MAMSPSARATLASLRASSSPYLCTENRFFLTTPTHGLHEASQKSYWESLMVLVTFLTPTSLFLKLERRIWAYSLRVNRGYNISTSRARFFAAVKQACLLGYWEKLNNSSTCPRERCSRTRHP